MIINKFGMTLEERDLKPCDMCGKSAPVPIWDYCLTFFEVEEDGSIEQQWDCVHCFRCLRCCYAPHTTAEWEEWQREDEQWEMENSNA